MYIKLFVEKRETMLHRQGVDAKFYEIVRQGQANRYQLHRVVAFYNLNSRDRSAQESPTIKIDEVRPHGQP